MVPRSSAAVAVIKDALAKVRLEDCVEGTVPSILAVVKDVPSMLREEECAGDTES